MVSDPLDPTRRLLTEQQKQDQAQVALAQQRLAAITHRRAELATGYLGGFPSVPTQQKALAMHAIDALEGLAELQKSVGVNDAGKQAVLNRINARLQATTPYDIKSLIELRTTLAHDPAPEVLAGKIAEFQKHLPALEHAILPETMPGGEKPMARLRFALGECRTIQGVNRSTARAALHFDELSALVSMADHISAQMNAHGSELEAVRTRRNVLAHNYNRIQQLDTDCTEPLRNMAQKLNQPSLYLRSLTARLSDDGQLMLEDYVTDHSPKSARNLAIITAGERAGFDYERFEMAMQYSARVERALRGGEEGFQSLKMFVQRLPGEDMAALRDIHHACFRPGEEMLEARATSLLRNRSGYVYSGIPGLLPHEHQAGQGAARYLGTTMALSTAVQSARAYSHTHDPHDLGGAMLGTGGAIVNLLSEDSKLARVPGLRYAADLGNAALALHSEQEGRLGGALYGSGGAYLGAQIGSLGGPVTGVVGAVVGGTAGRDVGQPLGLLAGDTEGERALGTQGLGLTGREYGGYLSHAGGLRLAGSLTRGSGEILTGIGEGTRAIAQTGEKGFVQAHQTSLAFARSQHPLLRGMVEQKATDWAITGAVASHALAWGANILAQAGQKLHQAGSWLKQQALGVDLAHGDASLVMLEQDKTHWQAKLDQHERHDLANKAAVKAAYEANRAQLSATQAAFRQANASNVLEPNPVFLSTPAPKAPARLH